MRFQEPGKETLALAIDVHYCLAAIGAEEVCDKVAHLQANGSLLGQQHIKGVTHLAFNLHGVIRPLNVARVRTDFLIVGLVAMRHDVHLNALVLLVVIMSV